MTNDNKRDDRKRNDDQDRKRLSDEELEDVAGGSDVTQDHYLPTNEEEGGIRKGIVVEIDGRKGKKKRDSEGGFTVYPTGDF